MKCSVISDTHGVLSQGAYNALLGSDLIIHAGDIGSPAVIEELETIAPVKAVLGNCDFDVYGPSITSCCSIQIEGIKIFVAHTPLDAGVHERLNPSKFVSAKWNLERDLSCPVNPDLVVHGHTHVCRLESLGGVLVLNPGSATKPRGMNPVPTIARFRISDGVVSDFEFISF